MNSAGERSFLRYENGLVCLLALTFGLVALDRIAMSFLTPFVVKDLRINNTEVGLLASALSVTWALSAYLSGRLCDRIGRYRIILVAATVAFSLCSVLSGFAGSFVALLLARLLMGAAEGPVLPISQVIMADASSERRRGFNMGVIQTFASNLLGAFLAPLVLVALATIWGWRNAFFLTALPSLICAAVAWVAIREPGSGGVASHDRIADAVSLTGLLGNRNVVLCVMLSGLLIAIAVLAWTFMPLYFVRSLHMTPRTMSIMISLLGLAAVVSGLLVPGLSDRLGRKPVMLTTAMLALLMPAGVLFQSGSLVVLGIMLFVGFFVSSLAPIVMATVPAESLAGTKVAAAIGLVIGSGEILGGVVAPLVGGTLADRWGLAAPVYLQGGCILMAVLLISLLRETAPNKVAVAGEEEMSRKA